MWTNKSFVQIIVTLDEMYKALVRSHIDYCDTWWNVQSSCSFTYWLLWHLMECTNLLFVHILIIVTLDEMYKALVRSHIDYCDTWWNVQSSCSFTYWLLWHLMKCTKLLFVHILIIVTLDEMYKALVRSHIDYCDTWWNVQSSCSFTYWLLWHLMKCTKLLSVHILIIVTLDEMYKALVRSHIDYCDTWWNVQSSCSFTYWLLWHLMECTNLLFVHILIIVTLDEMYKALVRSHIDYCDTWWNVQSSCSFTYWLLWHLMKCTKLLFVHILIIVTLDEMYKALVRSHIDYCDTWWNVQSSCSFTYWLLWHLMKCTKLLSVHILIIVTLDEMYKALVRSHIDYCDTWWNVQSSCSFTYWLLWHLMECTNLLFVHILIIVTLDEMYKALVRSHIDYCDTWWNVQSSCSFTYWLLWHLMKCTKLLFVHILIIVTLDEMYKALVRSHIDYCDTWWNVQSSCSFTYWLLWHLMKCTKLLSVHILIIVTLDEMYKALVRSHIDYCDTWWNVQSSCSFTLCTFHQLSWGVFFIIPRFFLAFMIFSFRCFSKDKFESSMRPKCFCSFTFATTVPLNISGGWLGLDFLQGNKTSVAYLAGSGLPRNLKIIGCTIHMT